MAWISKGKRDVHFITTKFRSTLEDKPMSKSSMSFLIWYENPENEKWVPLLRLNVEKGEIIYTKYTGPGNFREKLKEFDNVN